MCVSERERESASERERELERGGGGRERERERETDRQKDRKQSGGEKNFLVHSRIAPNSRRRTTSAQVFYHTRV